MKQYNFDEIVDRIGTDSIKWDACAHFFGADDILPVWVADTDFRTPDFIMEAIRNRLKHEVLGYTYRGASWTGAISGWLKRRHDWEIREEWISFSPGVVSALSVAILAFTRPGDKVLVTPPVYFPFFECVKGTGREVAEAPLILKNGRLHFDQGLMEQLIDDSTRMLLLCSPHNPGGMVWKQDELEALSELCLRRNILVISDEIHADLIFDGHTHIPFAKISAEAAKNCLVCMAPSKTFNVAGLSTSFVVIPDSGLKKSFDRMMQTLHIHTGNIPGNVALEAAFNHGDEWLKQMMQYVQQNYTFLEEFLSTELPRVKVIKPEATYLVWLDFRAFGMSDRQLNRFLVDKAKVGLNNGARFGTGGDGFMRINIGCPRSILKEALQRIANIFLTL